VTTSERTVRRVTRSSRQEFSLTARLIGQRSTRHLKVMRARGQVKLSSSWFVLAR
jgi:hypothetical protein